MSMSEFTKHLSKRYKMTRQCKDKAQGNQYAIKDQNLGQNDK